MNPVQTIPDQHQCVKLDRTGERCPIFRATYLHWGCRHEHAKVDPFCTVHADDMARDIAAQKLACGICYDRRQWPGDLADLEPAPEPHICVIRLAARLTAAEAARLMEKRR